MGSLMQSSRGGAGDLMLANRRRLLLAVMNCAIAASCACCVWLGIDTSLLTVVAVIAVVVLNLVFEASWRLALKHLGSGQGNRADR